MGLYYSEDGRYCTSTLSTPATTYLTPKGEKDTAAAVVIQKWWRSIINYRLEQFHNDMTSTSSEDTQSSLEVHGRLRRRFKRKLQEVESEEGDIDTTNSDTELVDYDSNGLTCDEDSDEDSDDEDDETQLQTVNNNNFLWDFIMSFFSFFKSLFGY